MYKNRPTVSLVIPVYNEENHLATCLKAIARQTVKPLEVIVVDNNSTDRTAEIAKQFPFVTLVPEQRQGVVYARDAGFSIARGDVIGRTDGDGILSPDWVARVQQIFSDPSVAGASGTVGYRDVGLSKVFDTIDRSVRFYLADRTTALNEVFLYGVNMAIRRSAWEAVRDQVCHERHMHEDIDLAVHMAKLHQKIIFAPEMFGLISPRQASAGPREFYKYVWSSPRVYADHGMRAQRYMYPVAAFVSALYVPIRLMYRGYDPKTQRFSCMQLVRANAPARVSPISDII